MMSIRNPAALGRLAVGTPKVSNSVRFKPYFVYVPTWSQPVREFETLIDVANFSAMQRVQLSPMDPSEGYPMEWTEPTEAEWDLLGKLLKSMTVP